MRNAVYRFPIFHQHMRLILAQWKSSAKKFAFYTMLPKKQIWFIFPHLFFVGFINNLKRFFCVCPKQTTKSVNVSSAEQQHNKGVRRRGGRGWWRSGKNRRARAEFIIQLSPFPTDWRGLSCVCGKFALIFFAYFAACSQWECVLSPFHSSPSLSFPYSVLGQALLLLRSVLYF